MRRGLLLLPSLALLWWGCSTFDAAGQADSGAGDASMMTDAAPPPAPDASPPAPDASVPDADAGYLLYDDFEMGCSGWAPYLGATFNNETTIKAEHGTGACHFCLGPGSVLERLVDVAVAGDYQFDAFVQPADAGFSLRAQVYFHLPDGGQVAPSNDLPLTTNKYVGIETVAFNVPAQNAVRLHFAPGASSPDGGCFVADEVRFFKQPK